MTYLPEFLVVLKKSLPTRAESGTTYMRFGKYWFAIGRNTPGLIEWQYNKMLSAWAKGIVWC